MLDRNTLIHELCGREWNMFVQVNNRGGKASCQNDELFFRKMRTCQFSGWSDAMLQSYQKDLIHAENAGRNLPMEKYAWMAKIKEGMKEEYVRRHNEIWPELVELLKTAGICNYTIWTDGNSLFGYYECEKGIEYAAKTQAQSPIVDKWNEYMKDVMVMEMDPVTGAQPQLSCVFKLD